MLGYDCYVALAEDRSDAIERFQEWPYPGGAYFIRKFEPRDIGESWYLDGFYGLFEANGELLDADDSPTTLRIMAENRYLNMEEVQVH